MNEKYARQMKKGVFDMLVLKLLEKQQKYGYQLISELKEKSGELFLLKEGTLYPILYRLEDDGLVQSNWSSPQGKQMARKYYQITDKGKETFHEIAELWIGISHGVQQIMED
ncbi:MAG: PadR family transcriptional regulator [Eubacterium sp.]|nr:PadR family transcriptional regulator [Eubacterium sp.]